MSETNSLYQADLVFDGNDGEMKGKEIKAFNYLELIEEIEKFKEITNQPKSGHLYLFIEMKPVK